MGLKQCPGCMLAYIPKLIRLVLAWVLVTAGATLMITPIPGGIILLGAGILLLYCTSVFMRKLIDKKLSERPRIYAPIKPFLQKCDACFPDKTLKVLHPSCHSLKGRGFK
jgi:hypothetical protein